MKKAVSLVLVVITILSVFTITSSAINWPNFSRSVPIKSYTISTGNNTTAYSSSSLSSKKGTIYASDEIYIEKIGRNSNGTYYAYGSYPISSGRKYAYIPLSVITKASAPSEKITAKTSATTYRRASTSNTYGSIDKGDYVYKLATSGNYTQVLYNVGSKSNPSAWKMAWVKTSVYNSMKGTSSSSSTVSSAAVSAAQSAFNTVFAKNSYSIDGNVLIVKGVRMTEYPIGSKFENCYYANVNGNRVYTGAKQCYGYACYIEHKLYGHCYHTASGRFPDLEGSKNVTGLTEAKLKSLITSAGVGAHLRSRSGHSMVLIGYTDSGFTVADANVEGTNRVDVRTYTWSSYLNTKFGKSGFSFIEIHK